MYYSKSTEKSEDELRTSLLKILEKSTFALQHEHNLQEKLEIKNLSLDTCKIFDVCNPFIAKELLDIDTNACVLLPCSLVIYKKESKLYLGFIELAKVLTMLNPKLEQSAKKLENELKQIVKNTLA